MSNKHQFVSSVIQVLKHNRDGSRRTQQDRAKVLLDAIKTLHGHGYQLEHVHFIKRRHIEFLVQHWLTKGTVGAGTLKNRMSCMRWLMGKLNKLNTVPTNDELNIPKRIYVTNKDKSRDLAAHDLVSISDLKMQLSLQGQKLFGLRMEESLKIQPFVADMGLFLFIRGSWAKGGRDRFIPILTEEQRQWLNECKTAVKYKSSSLIPDDTTYKTYRKRFEKRCERAGIDKRHGLRHYYAQMRYRTIAGFDCIAKGGFKQTEMTLEQRNLDKVARLQVSHELGHSRVASITSVYCGK